jgi:hypothetical protein
VLGTDGRGGRTVRERERAHGRLLPLGLGGLLLGDEPSRLEDVVPDAVEVRSDVETLLAFLDGDDDASAGEEKNLDAAEEGEESDLLDDSSDPRRALAGEDGMRRKVVGGAEGLMSEESRRGDEILGSVRVENVCRLMRMSRLRRREGEENSRRRRVGVRRSRDETKEHDRRKRRGDRTDGGRSW